ncbi:S-adenosyl-L-homocysteine hydrolase [Marimonas sp. MJW-29]|uniref:S-adenosyl-L-homocysteine hydrolase n=1 Tax=Sulfitobacter sediminis TaxID=3234186 RepID=A0ABV3RNF7_9RHOB
MKPLISVLALAFALAAAPSAQAQEVCMTADEMKAALIDWYGERPISEPTETNEQIWVSQETGTWTMIRMFSDGNACVLAQGDGWMTGRDEAAVIARLSD